MANIQTGQCKLLNVLIFSIPVLFLPMAFDSKSWLSGWQDCGDNHTHSYFEKMVLYAFLADFQKTWRSLDGINSSSGGGRNYCLPYVVQSDALWNVLHHSTPKLHVSSIMETHQSRYFFFHYIAIQVFWGHCRVNKVLADLCPFSYCF